MGWRVVSLEKKRRMEGRPEKAVVGWMDAEEDKEERTDEAMERFYMIEDWRSSAFIPHQTQNRVFVLIICTKRTMA